MKAGPILLFGTAFSIVLANSVVVKASDASVSVHSGPGPQWPVVTEIPAGDEVFVADCVKGGGQHDWCKITIFGSEGYIHEGALAPVGDRVVVAPVLTSRVTDLRRSAKSNAPIVSVIPAGTQVNVAHCTHGWLRGWCKINVAGSSGYLRADSLHRHGG
jgi:uncharacterized protein YraI